MTFITFKIDVIRKWEDEADEALVAHVNRLRREGQANWLWDPEVDGVLGLVKEGTNQALIVIYRDGDWEASAEVEEAMANGFIEAMEDDPDELPLEAAHDGSDICPCDSCRSMS